MITRNLYLNSWKAYPTKPQGWMMGRVIELTDRKIVCRTWGSGQKHESIKRGKDTAWLSLGDIIAWPPVRTGIKAKSSFKQEMMLLVPSQIDSFLEIQKTESATLATLELWSDFQFLVRKYFIQKGFVELQTPTLVDCPGTEPFLDPFTTEFQMGRSRRKYFLPTSPELHLKKSLARGMDKVFEIKTCFRNGEISQHHQPEFLMLEWYRAGENLASIQKDCENLFRYLANEFNRKNAKKGNQKIFKFQQQSYFDLFKKHTALDLENLLKSKTEDASSLMREVAVKKGLIAALDPKDKSQDHWQDLDDLMNLLFTELVEPSLSPKHPIFVTDYPESQAAYARVGPRSTAERFELYWQGLEIANAFHEVNDPGLQRQRMIEDLQKKRKLGRAPVLLDEDFFRHLDFGLPPSSGIALGLERLFMALCSLKSLSEVRLFPMAAPE